MPACNACGAEVAFGVKFCPQCGQPMSVAPAASFGEESPAPAYASAGGSGAYSQPGGMGQSQYSGSDYGQPGGSGYGQQQPGYGGGPGATSGGTTSPSAPSSDNDKLMGALAYVTIIPAIIFLLIEPYNKNRFIRFHAFQCIFFALGAFALSIGNMILSIVLGFVPVVGWVISLVLGFGIPIAILVTWLLLVIKAYQGQEWRLPVIGNLAAKQA